MEPVVRRAAKLPEYGFPLGETRLMVCALADDLALFADSVDHLQQRVNATSEAASIVGPRFRPEKCAVVARLKDMTSCRHASPSRGPASSASTATTP